jgi:uncharacterized protein YdcH (DUF465 family)
MNAAEAQDVKHLLLQNDDHYRALADQHHQLDDQLHRYTDRHYLSPSEQIEEVTLKKKKLAVKDQMEALARNFLQRSS